MTVTTLTRTAVTAVTAAPAAPAAPTVLRYTPSHDHPALPALPTPTGTARPGNAGRTRVCGCNRATSEQLLDDLEALLAVLPAGPWSRRSVSDTHTVVAADVPALTLTHLTEGVEQGANCRWTGTALHVGVDRDRRTVFTPLCEADQSAVIQYQLAAAIEPDLFAPGILDRLGGLLHTYGRDTHTYLQLVMQAKLSAGTGGTAPADGRAVTGYALLRTMHQVRKAHPADYARVVDADGRPTQAFVRLVQTWPGGAGTEGLLLEAALLESGVAAH